MRRGLRVATIQPKNTGEWRAWLERYHDRKSEVWVRYVKAKHGRSMTWSDAVDEALCFGWIDTTARPVDDKHYDQRFTPRKIGSKWSLVNRRKAERLIAEGRMTTAWLHQIELAKRNGTWHAARAANPRTQMPPELEAVMNRQARAAYAALAPGYQNLFRRYVAEAKQADTRLKRATQCSRWLLAGVKNPWAGKATSTRRK
jgi:uncharacterized protein YdeI (YjbR/CyaY-like superfamily)